MVAKFSALYSPPIDHSWMEPFLRDKVSVDDAKTRPSGLHARLSTCPRPTSSVRSKIHKKYRDRLLTRDGKSTVFKQPIPRVQGGYVVGSFVSSIKWGTKKIPGNVLRLEGFGS